MSADFNLSRPKEANSYSKEENGEWNKYETIIYAKHFDFSYMSMRTDFTSQEEKAERSRWAPACVKALLVSFYSQIENKHKQKVREVRKT